MKHPFNHKRDIFSKMDGRLFFPFPNWEIYFFHSIVKNIMPLTQDPHPQLKLPKTTKFTKFWNIFLLINTVKTHHLTFIFKYIEVTEGVTDRNTQENWCSLDSDKTCQRAKLNYMKFKRKQFFCSQLHISTSAK